MQIIDGKVESGPKSHSLNDSRLDGHKALLKGFKKAGVLIKKFEKMKALKNKLGDELLNVRRELDAAESKTGFVSREFDDFKHESGPLDLKGMQKAVNEGIDKSERMIKAETKK